MPNRQGIPSEEAFEMTGGSEDESVDESVSVELELDREGRISGTLQSGLNLSPFRAFYGTFAKKSPPGEKDLQSVLTKDCEYLFGCEEIHGDSWTVHANCKPKDLRCSLERLAKDVFDFHTKGCQFDPQRSCAEWWVQVRGGNKTTGKKKGSAASASGGDGREFNGPTGIGFHWDKDEDLVDQTGVTVCPQISTVTYLTTGGSPTMVLDKTPPLDYSDEAGMYRQGIKRGWLSHPEAGKHIAFGGRLLHGAPRRLARPRDRDVRRVTFLVNIWLNYTPVGLEPLPEEHAAHLTRFQGSEKLLHILTAECDIREVLVRRRGEGLWVEEKFGPTGVEHTLEFKWPMTSHEEVLEMGCIGVRFDKGSEARIGPSLEGLKRKRG